jgi:hypothetical protein
MVLIHAQAAIVQKRYGALENIIDNFMHIKCCSVIDAIPLMDSPAILILGTIAWDHEPVSPTNFCCAMGEATATKLPLCWLALFDNQSPSGQSNPFCS